jgi:hypothetical protein
MSSLNPLQVARQKLQASDVPFQLRVTYYLRVSCLQMDAQGISYTNLMRALFIHNPEWLQTCKVTEIGSLQSSDRTINQHLSSIEDLHMTDLFRVEDMPMAA